MLKTHVRPSRDLRNNYSEITAIVKNHDHVIITNNGKGEAVMIGIEEYALYEEFLHHKYVEQELARAEAQANDPDANWKEHDELWHMLGEKYDV